MGDTRTLHYLNMVMEAIDKSQHEIKTTTQCIECEGVVDRDFSAADHWVMFDRQRNANVVVIGCEGYYQINPASVGIHNEHWSGIEGVNV